MTSSEVRTSKFLSLVLRHHPERIGLRLDPGGWADVGELLAAAEGSGLPIDRGALDRVVAGNDKARFSFSDDGRRIRANQGHSLPADLGLEPLVPPETLFHGTAAARLTAVQQEGVTPQTRLHVHLSSDPETALAVGRRHGKPVVLAVRAGDLHRHGHPFYRSVNGVWLTGAIPPGYFDVSRWGAGAR